MVRSGRKFALVPHVLSLCVFALIGSAAWAAEEEEEERNPQKNTFAIRPKIGANWIAKGDLKEAYGELIQGELGLKGTLGKFGFEVGLGGMGRGSADLSGYSVDVRMLSLRLTGTYEFNPLAGIKGHVDEGNIYLGGGFGFYPITLAPASDGFGYGFHLLIGGEYFFAKHFGLFGELQYGYTDFDMEQRGNINLYGFSTLVGLSVKF